MLSTKQFGQNKIFRYTAYAIVIGFALLMFLPGSYNIMSLFQPQQTTNIIEVEGKEIFANSYEAREINEYLKYFQDNSRKSYQVAIALNGWENPLQQDRIAYYINRAITNAMNMQLVDDLGLEISDEKLVDFVQSQYNQYLENLKNDPSRKNEIPLTPKEYYIRAKDNLKKSYLINLINGPLFSGVLPPLADVMEAFHKEKYEVQVDFALYTFDDFTKDDLVRSKINKEDLKKFYLENVKKMDVKQAEFSTEEEAQQGKTDKTLFQDPIQPNAPSKFNTLEIKASEQKDLFEQLKSLKVGDVSDVVKKDGKFYVYKIMSIDQDFDDLSETSSEYQSIITKYANNKYEDFKDDYVKKGKELLNSFLTKAKSGTEYKVIGNEDQFSKVKVGRTDYFNLDPLDVTMLPEIEKDDKGKKNPGTPIPEFYNKTEQKMYNEKFFVSAFSLNKGQMSNEVETEVMQGKTVFFVIKKVDEKKPDFEKDLKIADKKGFIQYIRYNDIPVIRNKWYDYLKSLKDYSVDINKEAFYRYYGLKRPDIPKENQKEESNSDDSKKEEESKPENDKKE